MANISKTELRWLITALNTHIEECADLMHSPAVGNLTHAILCHQAESYRALRCKLEIALAKDDRQIRII